MTDRSVRLRSPLFISRTASFTAIGVAAGLALAAVPNVELVTAICFTAGFLMGPLAGIFCGGLTEALFAGFHPMGSSLGFTLIAQIIGMSIAGLLGGLAAMIAGMKRHSLFVMTVVGFGVLSTIVFDLITNLAYAFVAGFSFSQLLVVLAAALPFAGLHLLSNIIVFSIVLVPLLPRLEKALQRS